MKGPCDFSHDHADNPPTFVWDPSDLDHVTCTASQKCYYCDEVDTETAVAVRGEVTQEADCVHMEITEYSASFTKGFADASEEFVTALKQDDAHDYGSFDEDDSIRPVYDETTGEWSKATLVFHCRNTETEDPETGDSVFDPTHDKVIENVDRADYTAFDEKAAKAGEIASLDLNPNAEVELQSPTGETRTVTVAELLPQIDTILGLIDEFPLNLITYADPDVDEQPIVDSFTASLDDLIVVFFNAIYFSVN